jgi:hypothetical protein
MSVQFNPNNDTSFASLQAQMGDAGDPSEASEATKTISDNQYPIHE